MSARDQSSAPLLQIGDDVFVNDGGDLELCTQKKIRDGFAAYCVRVCACAIQVQNMVRAKQKSVCDEDRSNRI